MPTTCPQRIQIKNRRKTIAGYRRKPAWKKMLADHAHIPRAECSICHRKHEQVYVKDNGKEIKIHLTINHTDRRCYLSEEAHNTWNPDRMRIECTTCNFMYEKGMVPCPDCLKEGRVHYIRWDEEECWSCWIKKHPEEFAKVQKRKEDNAAFVKQKNADRAHKLRIARIKHPCTYRTSGQKCRLGGACEYGARKAPKECKRGYKPKRKKGVKVP